MLRVLKTLWTGEQTGSLSAKPRVVLEVPSPGQCPHLSMGLPSTVALSGLPPSLGVGLQTSGETIREAVQVRFPTRVILIHSKWTQNQLLPLRSQQASVRLCRTLLTPLTVIRWEAGSSEPSEKLRNKVTEPPQVTILGTPRTTGHLAY